MTLGSDLRYMRATLNRQDAERRLSNQQLAHIMSSNNFDAKAPDQAAYFRRDESIGDSITVTKREIGSLKDEEAEAWAQLETERRQRLYNDMGLS